MQEASDAHSKTADSDTVSTYQVSSVQLVTDMTSFSVKITLKIGNLIFKYCCNECYYLILTQYNVLILNVLMLTNQTLFLTDVI